MGEPVGQKMFALNNGANPPSFYLHVRIDSARPAADLPNLAGRINGEEIFSGKPGSPRYFYNKWKLLDVSEDRTEAVFYTTTAFEERRICSLTRAQLDLAAKAIVESMPEDQRREVKAEMLLTKVIHTGDDWILAP